MIRNALLSPLARTLRRRGGRDSGAARAFLEYLLFLAGWLLWPFDWLVRAFALVREAGAGPEPLRIRLLGVPLVRPGSNSVPLRERTGRLLEETRALFEPLGLEVEGRAVEAIPWPPAVPPPECGAGALLGGFFAWASARAQGSPWLTVYVVADLGPFAGCAVPGADWVVVDGRTDGTTVAHELGHLADLWAHDSDPDNLMTNRPGGAHARITPFQAAMIRTSRFAVPVSRR